MSSSDTSTAGGCALVRFLSSLLHYLLTPSAASPRVLRCIADPEIISSGAVSVDQLCIRHCLRN